MSRASAADDYTALIVCVQEQMLLELLLEKRNATIQLPTATKAAAAACATVQHSHHSVAVSTAYSACS
eukprot:3137-Heterococcus_DN1.PRE.1